MPDLASAPDFQRLRSRAVVLIVHREYVGAVEALGLLQPKALEAQLEAGEALGGRGRAALVPLPNRSEGLVLRPVLRGGLLGRLLGDRLLGLGRPHQELQTTAALRSAGAPVPHPVLVAGRRRNLLFWAASVGTVHEERTVDMLAFLKNRPERDRILAAADAAGVAIRRFHDAGGRHPDLQLKNLLLRESENHDDVIVIDLDRARRTSVVSPRARMSELMRLYRSVRKQGFERAVGARGSARFFAAYLAGDRSLRRAMRVRLPAERMRLAFHSLHYSKS